MLASCQTSKIQEIPKAHPALPPPITAAPGKSFFPKALKATPEVFLDHTYFQISYNPTHLLPNWVTYHLFAKNLRNSSGHRKDNFIADPILVNKNIPYLESTAYRRTGYDRGHMAPSGDFKWDQEVNDSTFMMSNMAPQKPNLNRKAWRYLEERIRDWACTEGALTIVVGPILENDLPKLPSGASIPRRFFKAVLDETPPRKAVGFVYFQEDSGDVYSERAISVQELEKIIGYELFLELNIPEREQIESTFQLKDWVEGDCG